MTKNYREISDEGREFIQREEGTILFAYDDAVYPTRPVKKGEKIKGTITIGTGHTGPDVKVGMRITEAQADKLLDEDLDIVEQFIAENVVVPLSNNQHSVVCSAGFNWGIGGLGKSSFLRKLNTGDYEGAGKELLKWVHTTVTVNGKKKKVKSDGLVARRARELALWNTPDGTEVIVTQGDVAEPKATEIAEPPIPFGLGWITKIFNIFGSKETDPVTNKRVSIQPINPVKSKTSWSIILTVIAGLLAFKGIDFPQEQRDNIVLLITVGGAFITWVMNTFFRGQ